MRAPADILAAIDGPEWWAPWFKRGDWSAWRAFLAAAFALPMTPDRIEVFRECTGRGEPPTERASEVWAICGRRGGKTRIMATVAAYLSAFVDWRPNLAPGEVATVMLIAKDRKQARTAMRYLRSLFKEHPTLAQLVERETDEALELSCRVVVEITTASFRSARGYTVAAVIADELAFWVDDEGSANPADEVIDALKPAMATMPGAMLMVATSPYARRGPVWEAFRKHYGKDGRSLVWKAPTRRMNPLVPQSVIDEATEADPASAAAEYMAEFRTDIETFISREAIDAATVPDRRELPPAAGVSYVGFADAAGGSGGDSFAACVCHVDAATGRCVVDAVRERRPPFSPEETVAEMAAFFASYGVSAIAADRWGGDFPPEQFRKRGVTCEVSERTKSDIYRDFLPLINSGKVELPDVNRVGAQFANLERRTARGGKDSIDHPPGAHDDLANAVAGAVVLAVAAASHFSPWRREMASAPVPPPARAGAIFATLWPGKRGEAAVAYFARATRDRADRTLVLLDVDVSPFAPPALFPAVARRLLDLGAACGVSDSRCLALYVPAALAGAGAAAIPEDMAADPEALALGAAGHVNAGGVKVTEAVIEKSRRLPLAGVLDARADPDDPIRAAFLIGVALGLGGARGLRAA